MSNHEDVSDSIKQLTQLGITEEEQQTKVLEYFYTLGKIIYNTMIDYDEEES